MCVCLYDTFALRVIHQGERGLMVSWVVMEYAWDTIIGASEKQSPTGNTESVASEEENLSREHHHRTIIGATANYS